jgi:hypothetical protein
MGYKSGKTTGAGRDAAELEYLKAVNEKLAALVEAIEETPPGAATWGSIMGTLTNQTDLNTALGLKAGRDEFGWGYYVDGETTPALQVITTTPAPLSIDALGGSSNEDFLPASSISFWDTVTNCIRGDVSGDSFVLRIGVNVSADSGNPSYIRVQVDIGTDPGPSIVIADRIVSVTKTPPYPLSVSFNYFTLTTFIANGARIFLSTDTGTVSLGGRDILISKLSSGV